jgi:hypothetical protein
MYSYIIVFLIKENEIYSVMDLLPIRINGIMMMTMRRRGSHGNQGHHQQKAAAI